jgi:hypothetical protein
MRLELEKDEDRIVRPICWGIDFREHVVHKKLYRLARYLGSIDDINFVMENHEMNDTIYLPISNNCQHYVATILAELLAIRKRERTMWEYTPLYYEVMKVLGIYIYKRKGGYKHNSNSLYSFVHGTVQGVVSIIGGLTIATVAVIPCTGIWGFLGFTQIVTTVALIPIPALVVLGIVLIAGSLLTTPRVIVEHLLLVEKQRHQKSKHKTGACIPYTYNTEISTKKYEEWYEEWYPTADENELQVTVYRGEVAFLGLSFYWERNMRTRNRRINIFLLSVDP